MYGAVNRCTCTNIKHFHAFAVWKFMCMGRTTSSACNRPFVISKIGTRKLSVSGFWIREVGCARPRLVHSWEGPIHYMRGSTTCTCFIANPFQIPSWLVRWLQSHIVHALNKSWSAQLQENWVMRASSLIIEKGHVKRVSTLWAS